MSQQRPSMSRRPGGSSRQGAGRPRRVAGQSGVSGGPAPTGGSGGPPGRGPGLKEQLRRRRRDDSGERGRGRLRLRRRTGGGDAEAPQREQQERSRSVSGLLASPRATVVLGLLAMVLVLVAVLIGGYAFLPRYFPGQGTPERPTADRPVVVSELVHRDAVDAAAKDTKTILSTDYQNYDAERTEALGLMTDTFAQEYGTTLDDIKQEFLGQQTQVDVTVVGQGVVRASSEQVQALLFLNQSVKKKGKERTVTPYRALVTVTDTDQGWLVSDLQTK